MHVRWKVTLAKLKFLLVVTRGVEVSESLLLEVRGFRRLEVHSLESTVTDQLRLEGGKTLQIDELLVLI